MCVCMYYIYACLYVFVCNSIYDDIIMCVCTKMYKHIQI